MTVHALVVEPPRPGRALPGFVEGGPLDEDGAATLAAAAIRDAAVAATESGGDLLVNYPPAERLDGDEGGDGDDDPAPEAALRDLLSDAVGDLDDVRFEVQVGGSFAARAGNAVTHLLDREGVDSVAVLDGRAPTLDRTTLDEAAMRLRRSAVVLGPAPGGRVAYAGFGAPVEFDGAWTPPALETLADRGRDAGHDVDFLPVHPRLDDPAGLATVVSLVRARRTAGRRVPAHTAAAIEDLGLRVAADGDGRPTVVADG